ncbi:protein kinase domain-containing protein [Blastococcus brunescens]|uniref:non-specific serine/threonine protein kinase n=1 Tax=Blastococcus brunescens TaxID=1564165 RepID=A0ABZ1B290_9ACTN|nr:protein kinase [Blastococcus sp. BMG 8361]WRL63878.1 protein kinase [Blastococcus sp. BMG 8361]
MVEPGRRCLGDRYDLHQLIAAGGMGQVWHGHDLALDRPVAVKVLRSEYTGDPTFVARFRAEAQHAASLSHPNIAAVFDYGEETAQDGTGETLAYLVMELVEGEPLSALVAREGALGTETTLALLRQTAFGLGEAHGAGMVHRDVKPGNILVRPDGGVKITDFGIAWSARSVALTRTGQVIGTPQYLSPEQAEGRPATPASDVYALGLIGYECLTGQPAFSGDNAVTIALKQVQQDPEPLPEDLPAEVRELIGRALAKDADTRFPDGAAFVAAIDDVLAGRPLPAAPATVAVPSTVSLPAALRSRDAPDGIGHPPSGRAPQEPGGHGAAPAAGPARRCGHRGRPADGPRRRHRRHPAEAAEQRDSGSIVLDADQYIGRPVDEVVRQLTRLGLDVQPRAEPRDDVIPDQVTGVEPAGRPLSPGDTVVVTYATGDASSDGATDRPAVTGAAGGGSPAVQEEAPAPAPAPVPEPEPEPEPEPAPRTTARTSAPAPTLAGTPTTSSTSASPTTTRSTVSEQPSPTATTSTSSSAVTPPPE